MSELRQRTTQQRASDAAASLRASTATTSPAVKSDVATAARPASSSSSGWALVLAALLLLLPVRLLSAVTMPILDCDETFNYWEPLHYLMFGRGLQTWEYSPVYGLRSYAYLWLISPAAWAAKWMHDAAAAASTGVTATDGLPPQEVNKLVLFYAIRVSFAVACSLIETRLLCSVRRVLGTSVAHWMLLFLGLSAGMGHAAQAFLPQTFTMMAVMLTLDAWMNRNYRLGIFFTGVASLVGWPFSVLLSVPLAIEVLWVYRGRALAKPVVWGAASAAICVLPCLLVDFGYFRRFIFAVVNIAVYNSNSASEHGANLYGKDPASFYFQNLALNFNVAAGLALVAPLLLLLARVARGKAKAAISELAVARWLLPFYLWLGIFLSMPHKEERFLFVVYPYIALCAAVAAFVLQSMLRGCFAPFAEANGAIWGSGNNNGSGSGFGRALSALFRLGVCAAFVLLSLSRRQSLVVNYGAPLDIWTAVHERAHAALRDTALLPFPLSAAPDPQSLTLSATSTATHASASNTAVHVAGAPELVNVCVGKEWYRFPAHFFLPTLRLPSGAGPSAPPRTLDFTLRFLESDFGGLLPKAYLQEWELQLPGQEEAHAKVEQAQPKSRSQLLADRVLSSLNLTALESLLPHMRSRPGTHRVPSHMNDLNAREDGGRFVPAASCHFIVDLALPAAAQREPLYAEHEVLLEREEQIAGRCVAGWRWRVEFERPFLDAAASPNALARAFWIPSYSERVNVMRPYQLLQRVPIECKPKVAKQTATTAPPVASGQA